MLALEHQFTLPMGFMDEHGSLHRDGTMRLATAADEILPLQDPRVQKNPAYLSLILLSRVVTRLGTVEPITPKTMEGLFAGDLARLQELYNEINGLEARPDAVCPECHHEFAVDAVPLGA
jgi:phage FluMu protein gp41